MSSKAEPKSEITTESSTKAGETTASSKKVLCFWSKTDPDWNAE